MRPTVNSEKRLVQVTLASVAALGIANVDIVNAKQDPTLTDPADVNPGTVVTAVYAEMWLLGDGQQPATATALVMKAPAGTPNISSGEFANLNGYLNKKNILEMHQGLVGDANANPVPFFRNWIKIPKGKSRMGLGDRITFQIKGITEGTQFCGHFIYKAQN